VKIQSPPAKMVLCDNIQDSSRIGRRCPHHCRMRRIERHE
jgi:hypothetical protein